MFSTIIGSLAASHAFADECSDAANTLRPLGENCVQIADFNQRRQCFDQAGNRVPRDVMDRCKAGGPLADLKNQLVAEEKTQHPDQPSALDGNGGPGNGPNGGGRNRRGRGNGGPGNGMPMNNGGPMNVTQEQCNDVGNKIRPAAMQCNTIPDFNQRKQCFSQAPQSAGLDPKMLDACDARGFISAVKADVMADEKAKNPDQPSAIGGPNGGPGNGSMNGGNGGGRNRRGHGNGNGNGGPGNGGPGNGMPMGGGGPMNVTQDQCNDIGNRVRPAGMRCNSIPD